jgi:Tol biopolymer transport system component
MSNLGRAALLAATAIVAGSLTTSHGSATPPGKNGLLLFEKSVAGTKQLFTMAPDGSRLRQLTRDARPSLKAAWSPDGRRIAFAREYTGRAAIMLMNADGTHVRQLTPSGLQDTPTFTPDGRRLVYARSLADDSLWVMDVDGSHARRLTRNAPPSVFENDHSYPFDDGPVVSPDGKQVTFVRRLSASRQALFVVRMDGTGLRRLTPWKLAADTKLDWAPDGSRVVFSSRGDVLTIRPDGSSLTRLTNGGHEYCSDSYSPDGTLILLLDDCFSDAGSVLFVMSAKGGAPRAIPHGRGAHKISWGSA